MIFTKKMKFFIEKKIIDELKRYEINFHNYSTCIKEEIKPEIIASKILKEINGS